MHDNEPNILSEYAALASSVRELNVELEKQIRFLVSLRDALQPLKTMVPPLMERIRSEVPASRSKSPSELHAGRDLVWKLIQRLMGGEEKFTIKSALLALEAATDTPLGKYKYQLIHGNLSRRTDVFRKNEDKTWTVIKH